MRIDLHLQRGLFNDVYYPLLFDYTRRYEVYCGGAGSGKSHFVFQKVILKALKGKRKVLVTRKVARANRDSTFQMAMDTLARLRLLSFCEVNKTNMAITMPGGSALLFYGLDDVEKLKSIANITDVVCEECSEMTEADVTQLDLRLRAKAPDLQMFFMFNPVSKANWTYKKWFADGAAVPETTRILRTTYRDNRFLPAAYVEALEAMRQTNPVMHRIYTLGEFASLDKLVYNNWRTEELDREGLTGCKLLVGLDFGFVNAPTALVGALLDEGARRVYVFDEYTAQGLTNDKIAQVILSKGYGKSVIIADSAEQKSIEEIRRAGVRRIRASAKGPDSVLHGIQKLQQYEIIVHPKCEATVTELQNYAWQRDRATGEYINKPVDELNHCLDALRYSMQCVKDNRLRTMDKGALGVW